MKKQNGFTLIEFVAVIILLGIISVYATSRYIGASGFSVYAAQEQAISIIRQIQLARMQSNISSSLSEYRLKVTTHCLGLEKSCNVSGPSSTSSNKLELLDDIRFSPEDITIDFDLLGAPIVGGVKVNNVKIDISNNAALESVGVCINSEGYVYDC